MDQHFVSGKVMVCREPASRIDGQFLHQRGTDAHDHRADDLTASGQRVQHTPRIAD